MVIVNTASHYWARLSLSEVGIIEGSVTAKSNLNSLYKFVGKWFGIASTLFIFGVGIGGYFYIESGAKEEIAWIAPWFFIIVVTGLNLVFSGLVAILEGCNRLIQIYSVRGWQTGFALLLTFFALENGLGLWAASATAMSLLIGNLYIILRHTKFFASLKTADAQPNFSWQEEILPVQWRYGVLAVVGYFSFFMITPVIFRFHGAEAAGQIGITLQLVLGIQRLAASVLEAKIPEMGSLASKGNFHHLDSVAKRVGFSTVVLAGLGGLCGFGIVEGLRFYGYELGSRFLPTLSLALLMASIVPFIAAHIVGSYFRSFSKVPVFGWLVTNNLLLLITNIGVGWLYGIQGVSVSYFLIITFFLCPASYLVLKIKRIEIQRNFAKQNFE
ncbi:MAG: hypothetical protein CMM55_11900 [Rhodospirillaceae bacterium]|nr:hypothetical protein [Rhodospirillaceae bacterium]